MRKYKTRLLAFSFMNLKLRSKYIAIQNYNAILQNTDY